MKFKVGDVVVVTGHIKNKNKVIIQAIKLLTPVNTIVEVEETETARYYGPIVGKFLTIVGWTISYYKLRHATDREKFLYHLHGQHVLGEK